VVCEDRRAHILRYILVGIWPGTIPDNVSCGDGMDGAGPSRLDPCGRKSEKVSAFRMFPDNDFVEIQINTNLKILKPKHANMCEPRTNIILIKPPINTGTPGSL